MKILFWILFVLTVLLAVRTILVSHALTEERLQHMTTQKMLELTRKESMRKVYLQDSLKYYVTDSIGNYVDTIIFVSDCNWIIPGSKTKYIFTTP